MEILKGDRRIQVVILHADWPAALYGNWQDGWLIRSSGPESGPPRDAVLRSLLVSSLRSTIQSLAASGKRVIVVDDVPVFAIDPMLRIRSQQIPARRVLTSWLGIASAADPGCSAPDPDPRISLASALIDRAVNGLSSVTAENLKPVLCPQPGYCFYRQGDRLFYIDSGHLSADGALYATHKLQLFLAPWRQEEYGAQ